MTPWEKRFARGFYFIAIVCAIGYFHFAPSWACFAALGLFFRNWARNLVKSKEVILYVNASKPQSAESVNKHDGQAI